MSDPFEAGRQSTHGQRYASLESRDATLEVQDEAFTNLIDDLKDRLSEHGVPAYTGEEAQEIRWSETPRTEEIRDFVGAPTGIERYLIVGNYLLIYILPGDPGYRIFANEDNAWLGDHFDMEAVFPLEELEGAHSREQIMEFCGRFVEPYKRWSVPHEAEKRKAKQQERIKRQEEVVDDISFHVGGFIRTIVSGAIYVAVGYAIYYFVYIQDIIGIASLLEPVFGVIEKISNIVWGWFF